MRYFQQIRKFEKQKFIPRKEGILFNDEVKQIKEGLDLDTLDIEELRNLRDFIVLFYSSRITDDKDKSLEVMDKISAITSVIDQQIFNLGGEIEFVK